MKVLMVRLRYVFLAAAVAFAAVAAVFAVRGAEAADVYWNGAGRSLPIYSVERTDKKIAITFDCAWGTDHTDAILSALEAGGVRATFFMTQFWVETNPDHVKKIDAAGHEIGTHSATHSHMSAQSEEEIRAELSSSSRAIEAVTGKDVSLFRPPFGDYDDLLIDTSNDMGLYPVQWDVDSLDWKELSAQDIVSRIVGRVKAGSIILCHNDGKHTAEALPAVLDTLKARGYEFVPVGELIYRDGYTIDPSGRQVKNA